MADTQPQMRHVLPVFIFFSLCGFYFIVYQMYASHAPDRFLEVHKASEVPVTPTGHMLPFIDTILERLPRSDSIFTPLISFFVAAFGDTTSSAYSTVTHFVWSFGCAIQLPLIEAQRSGVKGSNSWSAWFLSHPMIWGILYQRLSGGWIIPLWLIAFMLSRTRDHNHDTDIEPKRAESVFAGWWLGHTLPALYMLIPGQPPLSSTPIWVAFPILMTVSQQGYLAARQRFSVSTRAPRSSNAGHGHLMIQALYLSGFVAAAMAHVHLVIIPCLTKTSFALPTHDGMLNKFIGLAQSLYCFFAPATGFTTPDPATTTAASGVVHFVQFDVIIVFGAMWTALVWDYMLRHARDGAASSRFVSQFAATATKLAATLLVAAAVFSPGAATSAFLMFREYELQNTGTPQKRKSSMLLTIDEKPELNA